MLEPFSKLKLSGPVGLNIAHFLRENIINNRLQPGQNLPEAEVAALMGVSRQPVRDALLRLSEAGLLQIMPQRGTLVTRISLPGMEAGRFVRQAVERAVVRHAATQATRAAIQAMRRIIDAQNAALEAEEHPVFLKLDDALHQAFAESIGDGDAWTALARVKLQMDRVRYLSLPEATPGALLITQHRAIVDAIAAHDPLAAEQAMDQHLPEVLSALPRLVVLFPNHFDKADAP